jgi:hypothetical protein
MKNKENRQNALKAYNLHNAPACTDFEGLPAHLRESLRLVEYTYAKLTHRNSEDAQMSRQVIAKAVVDFMEDKRRFATN